MKTKVVLSCLLWLILSTASAQKLVKLYEKGDLSKFKAILKDDPDKAYEKDDKGDAIVHIIARKTDGVVYMQALADAHIDLGMISNTGYTPLHEAAVYDNYPMVRFLVEKGVDVNCPSKNGTTPMFFASYNGDLQMAEYLRDHGGKVDYQNQIGRSPVMVSVITGRKDIIEFFVDGKAVISAKDLDGNTTLLFACGVYYDKDRTIRAKVLEENILYIINSGANINCANNRGMTPLIICAREGLFEACMALVAKGAEIDAQNENGYTPLMLAAYNGEKEIVEYLLSKGADKKKKDIDGKTAYDYAIEKDHQDIAILIANF